MKYYLDLKDVIFLTDVAEYFSDNTEEIRLREKMWDLVDKLRGQECK